VSQTSAEAPMEGRRCQFVGPIRLFARIVEGIRSDIWLDFASVKPVEENGPRFGREKCEGNTNSRLLTWYPFSTLAADHSWADSANE
jgi:hypothetical protein